ncbi:hypothetical protein PVAND_005305 [Polypedilum vanderplanki]|uniref:Uncharacterized protein n=1 Tax=Polypedilum vanderplanki TaxID=319348 RepID=A0A9J6C0M2_POLVA|nr:hypothetical protein PVAND_005305 [Polypedilum vanderplanki]
MHLALFDDEKKINAKALESTQPFSISHNLVQRKHESNNMEMNRGFAVNSNNANNKRDEIDSISSTAMHETTATAVAEGKFNDFVTSTNRKTIVEHHRIDDNNESRTQSFFQFLKSSFNCCSNNSRKINEQTELNYPLNLHLRMNEIFSMHDKLCDIAESFNDLYSIEMVTNITGSFIMILFGIFFETKIFHFNGLGLFKLDYTFIFSAVSAATSYLIVLLQFDMNADFQKFITNTNTTFA